MSLVRVYEQTFQNGIKSITAIPDHYVVLPGRIAASNAVTVDGKSVIPAGMCVSNATSGGRASGLTPLATAATKFDGVIVNTEEVVANEDYVNVSVLVHGFVRSGALYKVATSATVATLIAPSSNTDLIMVL